MGVLWAIAGPGTVPSAGGAVVLGLNSHAVPTKKTEYTLICEVVTSLLKKREAKHRAREGRLEMDAGRCL